MAAVHQEGTAAVELVAINLYERLVVLDSGEMFPITDLIDAYGLSTEDPAEAVSFVAGPDSDGKWWAASVSAFVGGQAH